MREYRKILIKQVPFRDVRRGTGDDPSFTKKKIGGSLNGSNCITEEEKMVLLPNIIRTAYNNPGWNQAVADYFDNLTVEVPYDTGLELEVGVEYSTQEAYDDYKSGDITRYNKVFGKTVKPLNPANYVLWQYCLGYSRVANKFDEINSSFNISFYIEDKREESKRARSRVDLNNKALRYRLDLIADPVKLDNVLLLYGYAPYDMSEDEKYIILEKLSTPETVDKDSENVKITKFKNFCEDPQLMMKAFIFRCLNVNVLERLDNSETIIYQPMGGDTVRLGVSIEDAVTFLLKAEHRNTYTKILAGLDAVYNDRGLKYQDPLSYKAKVVEELKKESETIAKVEEKVEPIVEKTEEPKVEETVDPLASL